MKVGYNGIGKLGLPVAVATNVVGGHDVTAYDPNPDVWRYLDERKVPYVEEGLQELLDKHNIQYAADPYQLVSECDLIFVPVQTPHDPDYEGINKTPDVYKDFDYTFLKYAVEKLALAAKWQKKTITLAVISTVLPGTMEREIYPLLNEYIKFAYNPYFIAMSTVVSDHLDPEFVLIGNDDCDTETVVVLKEFYSSLHNKPLHITDVKSAELTKVAYNLFISSKIVFANTMMEICQKTGANVDSISDAFALATDRLLSPRYLRGGMGDSGGCHPRDLIAMSWLEQELKLSAKPFEFMTRARENQTEYLRDIFMNEYYRSELNEAILLGYAYKKNVNLTTGSCALLMYTRMYKVEKYDPIVEPDRDFHFSVAAYFIGIDHDVFKSYNFPKGSIVVDPWGIIKDQDGVKVIRVGRN